MGGEEGASEDLAEATVPTRAAAPPQPATRASSSSAPPTCGSSSPSAAPRCPATRSSASSPAATASRCTASTAPTPTSCRPARAAHRRRVGAVSSASVFLVQLQVEALDRNRLLCDVTRVLSDQHVNILSASVQTSRDRVAISRFTFEMGDPGAPRPRHQGRAQDRRRLRRLPDQRRQGDQARARPSPTALGRRRGQPLNSSTPARAWSSHCSRASSLALGLLRPSSRCRRPRPWRGRPAGPRRRARAGRPCPARGPPPRGCVDFQRFSSASRTVCSTRRMRLLDPLHVGARAPCRQRPTCPGWRAAAPWPASRSVTGRIASASTSSASLTARLPRNSSSSAATTSSLAAKKLSCAALKRSHSASSSARLARPARRQSVHQPLERAGRGRPVGARRQRLGLGDQAPPWRPWPRPGLPSSCGEVDAARLVEAVAGGAEPLPQSAVSVSRSRRAPQRWCAFHSSSSSRMRAPLVFHWILFSGWPAMASASATIASRSAAAASRASARRCCSTVALARDAGLDLVDLGRRARRGHRRPRPRRRARVSLARPSATSLDGSSVRGETLLQQLGRGAELVVLAGEVGQRLVGGRARVGADLTLALRRADEDGPGLVDPPEGLGGGAGGGGRDDGRRVGDGAQRGRGRRRTGRGVPPGLGGAGSGCGGCHGSRRVGRLRLSGRRRPSSVRTGWTASGLRLPRGCSGAATARPGARLQPRARALAAGSGSGAASRAVAGRLGRGCRLGRCGHGGLLRLGGLLCRGGLVSHVRPSSRSQQP